VGWYCTAELQFGGFYEHGFVFAELEFGGTGFVQPNSSSADVTSMVLCFPNWSSAVQGLYNRTPVRRLLRTSFCVLRTGVRRYGFCTAELQFGGCYEHGFVFAELEFGGTGFVQPNSSSAVVTNLLLGFAELEFGGTGFVPPNSSSAVIPYLLLGFSELEFGGRGVVQPNSSSAVVMNKLLGFAELEFGGTKKARLSNTSRAAKPLSQSGLPLL